jgi:hypothetical protein
MLVGIRDAGLRAARGSTADRLEGRAAWLDTTTAWFGMTVTQASFGRSGREQKRCRSTGGQNGKAGHDKLLGRQNQTGRRRVGGKPRVGGSTQNFGLFRDDVKKFRLRYVE